MKATELISELRAALVEVKRNNRTEISISGLENYLAEMEKVAEESTARSAESDAAQRERAKLQFERDMKTWEVQAKLRSDASSEMFKAVIEAGLTALKSAMLVNGGAAIALLAFLGNLLTKAPPTGLSFPISGIGIALLVFIVGTGCAASGTAFRYLSQAVYGASLRKRNESLDNPDDANKKTLLDRAITLYGRGDLLRNIAVFCALTSFVLFFAGGIIAYKAIIG